jgi:hypothetical protein
LTTNSTDPKTDPQLPKIHPNFLNLWWNFGRR